MKRFTIIKVLFCVIVAFCGVNSQDENQNIYRLLNTIIESQMYMQLKLDQITYKLEKHLANKNSDTPVTKKEVETIKLCKTADEAEYCEHDRDDYSLIWTVIQRRLPTESQDLSFNRPWKDYKEGFGSYDGEFYMGNDKIHELTKNEAILRIEMTDDKGLFYWVQYNKFLVQNETNKYRLSIGDYSGNATNTFGNHDNHYFSTYDSDNDPDESQNCAKSYKSGWWFVDECIWCNLNGNRTSKEPWYRIVWYGEDDDDVPRIVLQKAKMMIRSKEFTKEGLYE